MELKSNFSPFSIFSNPNFQTIFPKYFTFNHLSRFPLKEIYLKLPNSEDKLLLKQNFPKIQNRKNFYIVMIHGMEGCSESHYLLRFSYFALKKGFGTIRVNLRNCGSGLGLSKSSYHAGLTSDIESILEYVYKNISENIILAGFSLSANTVLKYFGETRKNYYSKIFSSVSPPLNLETSCKYIDSQSKNIYKNYFLKSLKNKIKKSYIQVKPEILNQIDSIETIFDFDNIVTAYLFDYKTANEYYKINSCESFLPKIQNQGFILHSLDDPVILVKDWLNKKNINSNLDFMFCPKGGHIGFTFDKYFFQGKCWLSETLINYYESKI